MSAHQPFILGEYVVDTGDPRTDSTAPQSQVDLEGSGVIYSRVRVPRPEASETAVTFMGTELWWIEPEIDAGHHLVLLTLMSPSWYVGRGRVKAHLERLDTAEKDSGRLTGERWRVHIDYSSLEGPPSRPKEMVDLPRPGGAHRRTASSKSTLITATTIRCSDST